MPEHPTPNSACAQALRQLADWLDDHPELPPVRHCPLVLRSQFDESPNARGELELVAAALGERARETTARGEVTIRGAFADGRVSVMASAPISALADEPPPEPAYEPILPREYSLKHRAAA